MPRQPISFWPAPHADWSLSYELIYTIDEALTERLPYGISKLERHDVLQRRLAALGSRLGFVARTEVSTGHRKFKRSGRFDVMWDCPPDHKLPVVFEIDSCWRHESLLKLGRAGEDVLKLWIYYGQRPFPAEPSEPGFRRLNILRIEPWRVGIKDSRRVPVLTPGPWPEALYPRKGKR